MSKKIKLIIVLIVVAALIAGIFFAVKLIKKGSNSNVTGIVPTTADGVVKQTPVKPIKPTGPLMAPPPPPKK